MVSLLEVYSTEDVARNESKDESILIMILTSRHLRLLVVLVGALSTLMPWFLTQDTFGLQSGDQYMSLFSGLLVTGNIGFSLGSMLFYVGLMSCTFVGEEWSFLGGLFMTVAILMSWLSVPYLPGVGMGMVIGILVTIYSWLPINFFAELWESTD